MADSIADGEGLFNRRSAAQQGQQGRTQRSCGVSELVRRAGARAPPPRFPTAEKSSRIFALFHGKISPTISVYFSTTFSLT
ncbi:MAG: hypothetical protein WAV07_15850 [Candidatus Contendobacter sp.]